MDFLEVWCILGLAGALMACESSTVPANAPTAPPSAPYSGAPWSQAPYGYPQGAGYPYSGPPGAPPPLYPPALPQVSAPPPVPYDPITAVDLNYLRASSASVLAELVAALPPGARARVNNIPLVPDTTVGDVNAYAACDEQHMPRMGITDGLLQVEAYTAALRATDELFGTQKLDTYLTYLATRQRPQTPIVEPPAGLIDPRESTAYAKVVRQHQLLEEQLAFVLGHELGHHYLGHTGCAYGQNGDRDVTPWDIGRLITRVVPVMNQPAEVAADVAGVNNLLTAGARRSGYHWTEGGALLTLDFFSRLNRLTPVGLLFSFQNSHPNPALREPVVRQAAATWRSNGGAGYEPPALP
jgi:hypothetical protein